MNYAKNSLTLKDNFIGTIKLTQKLSSLFLKEINPLFITGFQSENPIVLRISKDDFYIPLNPFKIEKLKISHGMIDMGKIFATKGYAYLLTER